MAPRSLLSYVGVFLAMAVGIGYASYRTSGSIVGAIGVATVASIVATTLLVGLDKRAAARIARLDLRDGDYPARITVVAFVDVEPQKAIAACISAIRSLPNFRSVKTQDLGMCVVARTRSSRDSWGERISAEARPNREGTEIHLRSVPALWTVTEDMRLNFQNVALILKHLHQSIGIKRVEPSEYSVDILRMKS